MAITVPVQALLWGALGVLAFSVTLPATRLAILGGLDGAVIGIGRAVVAAVPAAALLLWRREPLPPRQAWPRLFLVVLGVVIGFPLLSSVALAHVPASHGAVFVGLLPAATAVMAVLRAGERPSPAFWAAAGLGLLCVLGFAAVQGAGRPVPADGLILVAVALGALGYAEGAVLARTLGGWQVICWALVLALPLMLPVSLWLVREHGLAATPSGWAAFLYVALVSMFLGFFPWYRGLALGGVARVGQVQLMQPVLSLLWAALALGEPLGAATLVAAGAVLASVTLTQLAR